MDIEKLNPVLQKESILKTANALELKQAPQDVLQRYTGYALTHVPLGDTTRQLTNLQRVVVENKTCAIGTVVGPYGYGKTSTAVHLWNELREKKILAVPPFLWRNLPELMDAVYHWIYFEFSHGPKAFVEPLENLYHTYRQRSKDEVISDLGAEKAQRYIDEGRLLLDIRAEDVVGFLSQACELSEQAGYQGLTVFTDELQATLAAYKPSRDQFFADLFQIVKDTLGLPGHWALVISMDDDTEASITRLRSDLLQRLQRSALYFRVKDVYNRREYPAELWSAFEKRFDFDGSDVILAETLEAIGQVAARPDLGAGPRMVTLALSLAVKYYTRTSQPYTPLQFVDDFLAGLMIFDQRGKFISAVKKALDNNEVKNFEPFQRVIKLLAAYPLGCSEKILEKFELLDSFHSLPPLARRELIVQVSGGYILRYLAEEEMEPESIEQRLTKEFVSRFAPGKSYALQAAEGWRDQILLEPAFNGWRSDRARSAQINGVTYHAEVLQGTFDLKYPERRVALLIAAVPQSTAPHWKKVIDEVDIELRFELNYNVAASEPSRLLVSSQRPDIAIFQLNLLTFNQEVAHKILPDYLHSYYTSAAQLTPLLALALIAYLYKNRGDSPDDRSRVNTLISPLRQYTLSILLDGRLETNLPEFSSTMVGLERIKDLFRQQCRQLYPAYKTLITSKGWQQNLQQYNYALQAVISEDSLSIARGKRPWKATKEKVADALRIPGRRLTSLEPLLEGLNDFIAREEFSGRTAISEVTLRFKLHPLEEEILRQLDSSTKTVKRDGLDMPAVNAPDLIQQAKRNGYIFDEIKQIIELLQTRKYVDFDQRQNLLVRTIDSIDDLREAVQEQLNALEKQMQTLTNAIPEFETGRYPLARLRSEMAGAKERDELETVKAEIRGYSSQINAYASSQAVQLKEKLKVEQNSLSELVYQGIPNWLGREFLSSPLHDLLEKQRTSLVTAYQATLEEIRRARDESIKEAQNISGGNVEVIIKTHELLPRFTKQSRTLKTRLQSYEDRRDDLEAWHKVSLLAADLNTKARSALDVYSNAELNAEVNQLWHKLREQFESQPLNVLSLHPTVGREIDDYLKRITAWLESRREDFERQCQNYQQALAEAGLQVTLKVPFDQEHPTESYAALTNLVKQNLDQYLTTLLQRLNTALQVVRYAVQVQKLPLSATEGRVKQVLQQATILTNQTTPDVINEMSHFQTAILDPLMAIQSQEQEITIEVQQAVQQRSPVGSEINLMELLRTRSAEQQIDLRGLIIYLLEQGKTEVNLEALMKDLQSLFQKNQLSVYIKLNSPRKQS